MTSGDGAGQEQRHAPPPAYLSPSRDMAISARWPTDGGKSSDAHFGPVFGSGPASPDGSAGGPLTETDYKEVVCIKRLLWNSWSSEPILRTIRIPRSKLENHDHGESVLGEVSYRSISDHWKKLAAYARLAAAIAPFGGQLLRAALLSLPTRWA